MASSSEEEAEAEAEAEANLEEEEAEPEAEAQEEAAHQEEQEEEEKGDPGADHIDGAERPKKKDKSGIIYLSRVPPGMKHQQLRHILSQYGDIGRMYLAPEQDSKRKARKKAGGSSRKNYTDGWIEYKKKRVAKLVASTLNNTIMGGPKRAFYHDDIWNIKYLSGFKWHHLTEKLAYEKKIRDQKLRTEISQVKRENNLYLDKVEKARVKEKIEAKRKMQDEKRKLREAASEGAIEEIPRASQDVQEAVVSQQVFKKRRKLAA